MIRGIRQHDAQRAGRPHRQSNPRRGDAAATDVGGRPISDRREPGQVAEHRPTSGKLRAQAAPGYMRIGQRGKLSGPHREPRQKFPVPFQSGAIQEAAP